MDRDPPKTFPGLIDAHVHIKSPGGLAALAAAGIIAVRDAGVRGNAAVGREIPRIPGTQPAVVSARWALYKKGGYGSPFGVPVAGRDEISAEIHRLAEAGAGIIKVMASGLVSLREPGKITAGGFPGDELAFIVDEAARRGLDVMAHANGEEAIIASAEAGVRSVEHGFFMTARALEVLAKQGTFWTPTVGALALAADRSAASAEARPFVAGLIRSHQQMILHAHTLGVSLAVGTDCVLPDARHTEAYGAELMYFEQAGLSRDEVMAIARDSGAKLLGIRT
jgi:imidazolonepropionase-like amidohydrolase